MEKGVKIREVDAGASRDDKQMRIELLVFLNKPDVQFGNRRWELSVERSQPEHDIRGSEMLRLSRIWSFVDANAGGHVGALSSSCPVQRQ